MEIEHDQDQLCMNCGAVIFRKARLDAQGHMAISTASQIELQQVGGDLYFKCPACNAKNCVAMETSPEGLPQLRFTHVKT